MSVEWIVTPISVSVHLKEESPVFGEATIHVSVDDEAGGPFVVIKQFDHSLEAGELKLDLEQLQKVCAVAKELIAAHQVLEQ